MITSGSKDFLDVLNKLDHLHYSEISEDNRDRSLQFISARGVYIFISERISSYVLRKPAKKISISYNDRELRLSDHEKMIVLDVIEFSKEIEKKRSNHKNKDKYRRVFSNEN